MSSGPSPTPVPGARWVDPAVLARIGNLELVSRTVVEGFLQGVHRSPHLGSSLDFAEHRAYMPGDDIRRIDWRLYARTDRFYIKQFEAETNADLRLVVDVSGSMGFGPGDVPGGDDSGVTKLDYARFLAASLAVFARKQGDRIGLATFRDRIVDFVPPGAGHLDRVLYLLETATAEGEGVIDEPLLNLGGHLRRRGLVVVISDFYDEPEVSVRALRRLAAAGHDVLVFHLIDPAERDFPYRESTRFEDLESGETIPVTPEKVAEEYRERMAAHLETLREALVGDRIQYALLDTSRPLDEALFRFLKVRESLPGGRG